MFDQLRHLDRDVTFHMRIVGGPGVDHSCRDLLHVRPEEQALLRSCLAGKKEPRVLDIACGIGRHSVYAHSLSPDARITLVEANQDLRDYCLSLIPGALAYARFEDVPAQSRFDIALLMGNGLGVFGNETTTRHQLRRLLSLLVDGGCVLIETGNFATGSFHTVQHEIEYGGMVDGPFTWGYATREWLQGELGAAGFEIESLTHSYGAGPFFIYQAKKSA